MGRVPSGHDEPFRDALAPGLSAGKDMSHLLFLESELAGPPKKHQYLPGLVLLEGGKIVTTDRRTRRPARSTELPETR
jgi:hypothetical protein